MDSCNVIDKRDIIQKFLFKDSNKISIINEIIKIILFNSEAYTLQLQSSGKIIINPEFIYLQLSDYYKEKIKEKVGKELKGNQDVSRFYSELLKIVGYKNYVDVLRNGIYKNYDSSTLCKIRSSFENKFVKRGKDIHRNILLINSKDPSLNNYLMAKLKRANDNVKDSRGNFIKDAKGVPIKYLSKEDSIWLSAQKAFLKDTLDMIMTDYSLYRRHLCKVFFK